MRRRSVRVVCRVFRVWGWAAGWVRAPLWPAAQHLLLPAVPAPLSLLELQDRQSAALPPPWKAETVASLVSYTSMHTHIFGIAEVHKIMNQVHMIEEHRRGHCMSASELANTLGWVSVYKQVWEYRTVLTICPPGGLPSVKILWCMNCCMDYYMDKSELKQTATRKTDRFVQV